MLRRLFGGARSAREEFERGTAAAQAGRLEEGVAALKRAIELRPDYAEAHYNLGSACRDLGNAAAALACYRRVTELAPRFADAHVDLASLLREQRDLAGAEASLQRALALKPDSSEALLELGNVHKNAGDWRAAVEDFRRAIAADPGSARARWAHAVAQIPVLDDGRTDREERRRAFASALGELEAWLGSGGARDAFAAVADHQPFYLAYHEVPNRDLLARYGKLCASVMAAWQASAALAPPAPRARGTRIRLGIVSAHIADHSVWNALVRGWAERLDRRRFELHFFHLGGARDAETARAESFATAFHAGRRGFDHWARLIHGSAMDVLLYPEVGMDPVTAKLASLRLAPVQAATWGHPETTGLPTLDYFLSAQALEPPGAQANYTEALELLPGTGCWLPREAAPKLAPLPVPLPAASVRFVCPGVPFKYAAEHDALLVEIARRVPGGKLLFFRTRPEALCARLEARLRSAFQRAGLELEQHVAFVPWLEPGAFRALLRACDVYLDTVGFSGFNTALHAVSSGLPIVAREGKFLRGRLASGLLRHIGLDELVAASDAGYVELAVALANDAARRQSLRERIGAAREKLFEDDAPVRALEAFLLRATG